MCDVCACVVCVHVCVCLSSFLSHHPWWCCQSEELENEQSISNEKSGSFSHSLILPILPGQEALKLFPGSNTCGRESPANTCALEIICSCLWVALRKLDFHLHRVCSMGLHRTVNRHSNTQQPFCVRNSRVRHITKGSERDWLYRALSKLSSVLAEWQVESFQCGSWLCYTLSCQPWALTPHTHSHLLSSKPSWDLGDAQVLIAHVLLGEAVAEHQSPWRGLMCLHDHPGFLWIYDTGHSCHLQKVAVTLTGY